MKKLICLFLVFMIIPCTIANAVDYKNDYKEMSDDELKSNLSFLRYELNKRLVKAAKNEYLIEDDDIEIYFTGSGSYSDKYIDLEVVFVNKTEKPLSIGFDSICINGWETVSYIPSIGSTSAWKKRKDSIRLHFVDADLTSYKEMEEIEVTFHTTDENYRIVKKYGPIMFNFDGKAWN